MFDLYPCAQSSLTDLGHCAYERRTCPQCTGAYAVCTVCRSLGALCPGCVHRERLAAIGRGAVVFPAVSQASREGTAPTAVARLRTDEAVAQAGGLAHGDQAATLDTGSAAVYSPGVESPHSPDTPGLGAAPVDTPASPFVLLLLPVDLAGVPPVLQALAAVITPQALGGHMNGHVDAEGGSQPRLPRKTYLSDKPCPSEHTYKDTGKVLRFRGNNQCVPCSGQRKPRQKATPTVATEG